MNASDAGFLTHLEALRQVLWRSVAAVGVLLVPGFFAAPEVLGFLVRFTCPPDFKLNYFTPMEPLIVQLKLGLFLAVVAAMPVILRQAAALWRLRCTSTSAARPEGRSLRRPCCFSPALRSDCSLWCL